MAEKTTGAQQAVAGQFKKLADDQVERLNQAMDEAAKIQAKWVEQSLKSVDDANTLFKAGIKYWSDLSADVRKMTLDATKRASEAHGRLLAQADRLLEGIALDVLDQGEVERDEGQYPALWPGL